MLTPCVICAYPITEQHHILPRAYGGGDEQSNLVALCPNHHAAMHIVLTQIWWELNNQCRLHMFGRKEPQPRRKHRELYARIALDSALMQFVQSTVVPAIRAAGYPLHVKAQRSNQRKSERYRQEEDLYEEQAAWNTRKGQKGS